MESERHGQPDFGGGEDAVELQRREDLALEARVQDESNLLRARIFEKFTEHSITEGNLRWAIFDNSYDVDKEDSVSDIAPDCKDILIVVFFPTDEDGEQPGPLIRIVTNESYYIDEDNTEWMACDFSLDYDNDSQFYVHVIDLDEGKLPEDRGIAEEKVEEGGWKRAYNAPLFWVKDGELVTTNLEPDESATVDGGIFLETDEDEGMPIIPFGAYMSLRDELDALARARELMGEVEDLSPAYKSVVNDNE